ncbi:MAG: class I SAM-dependent methyltransferase family protein [Candidatus Hydrothermarchaeales archaeon]
MPSSKPAPRRNLSVAGLKKALKGRVDLKLNGWEILGDIMVVELGNGYTEDEKRLIGEKIIELHPKATTVINRKSIEDELRQPQAEVLAGTRTETIYKEEERLFKLDPTKVMFSFGNKEERKRMGTISSKDEIIVDMFACVGQFTIPIAKYSRPKKVYAVEKNPVAFEYLKENIRLNKLDNVEAVLGDCRDVCPKGVADRVVMGYLFETEKFLKTAIEALGKRGIIHYHFVCDAYKLEGEKKRIIETIKENAKNAKISKTVKVKSYAPKMYHWVLDIEVER